MNLFLLQIIADSAAIKDSLAKAALIAAQQKETLLDILMKGGPLMIPLGILLVIAIFVFFERYLAITKAAKMEDNFMNIIRDNIISGNVQSARNLARIIDKGIQRVGKEISAIERSMENVGKLELYKMEKNLAILSAIAYLGPLFGFLGTIFGMFQLFYTLAATNDYSLTTIAGGIYVKMISSATGLIIGITAYIGYRFLNSQIDKATNKMEAASADFIDILQEEAR
jgi:biopolymer transport protein ExbB